MSENTTTSNIGEPYGLPSVEVPEGHQATLRPVEGSEVPQVSIEPVPDNPEPDMDDPAVRAGVEGHKQQQSDVVDVFAAEHEQQLRQAHEREIAAAGEPANIGTDGQAHFLRMVPEQTDEETGEATSYREVCGTDGQPWPCDQAQEIEQRQAEQRGEQPQAASQDGTS